MTDTSIEILDTIRFVGATPQLATPSLRTLDAIASTLAANPSLLLIEVHAFGADAPRDQWLLGELRAYAVVAQLVARGVDRRRLRAVGEARPAHGSGPGPEFVIAQRAN